MTYWDNTFLEIHDKRKKNEESLLMYLTFQRPQWTPNATETKRKCSEYCRNFLPTNGNGYHNPRLSDNIHRGLRQIHDKFVLKEIS